MVEALGFAAALIAIGGFIWAMIRRFGPEAARKAEAISKARTDLAYYYNNWRESEFSSKHLHLLAFDEFRAIGQHRNLIATLSEEEQIFMFVCSIVHGLWGDWMPKAIAAEKLLPAVVTLLDGRRGWRPIWRAAYIIEALTGQSKDAWRKHLPVELEEDSNVREVSRVIAGKGVIPYLVDITRGDNTHLRDKAYKTLQEIDAHSPGTVPPEFNKANVPK